MNMKENVEASFAMIKKMIPMQIQQMKQTMVGQSADAEKAKSIDKMMEKTVSKVMDMLAGELSWEKTKADYVALYAETFSEDELKGLITFYRSPVGQTFTKKQPELSDRTMKLNQKRMMDVIPKIQAMVKEAREAAAAPAEQGEAPKKNSKPQFVPTSPQQEPAKTP